MSVQTIVHPNLVSDATVKRDNPDLHKVLPGGSGCVSLWWKNTPHVPGQRVGLIGHFAAESASAANQLLNFAISELKQHGVTQVIGPMDGNTWKRYRFITNSNDNVVPFLLEPTNDPRYPLFFFDNGFTQTAKYFSAITNNLTIYDQHTKQLKERLTQKGVTIRNLDTANYAQELRELFPLCLHSFSKNPFFTPISEPDFLSLYLQLKDALNPALVFIAEHESQPVGFILVVPDQFNAATVIVKTLARDSSSEFNGLGSVLLAEAQLKAYELGYRSSIHALFHEANRSCNLSKRSARIFREYSLFSKSI